MSGDWGFMGVDWEPRIDYDRMRRERVAKAQKALAESGADILFILRTEAARYLTSYRLHLRPAFLPDTGTTVLT